METFSMNVIAHTLSSNMEMIAPGVMGINFMKPEKPINTRSEVYKLVQEEEQYKAKSPTPSTGTTSPIFKPTKVPPTVPPKPKIVPVANAVPPPAAPKSPISPTPPQPTSQSASTICTDCGRGIVGPFVRLNDRNLHEECFKCSTCGSSLKNVGYHNISNKLYCDMHAKLAARVIAGIIDSPQAASPVAFTPVAPAPKPVQAPKAAFSPIVPPIPQSGPTPYGQTLPHSPSSSGTLPFRSISPQPYKRISGDFHRVTAPSSPPPGCHPSHVPSYSSGPLPFEMKPYMPPDQPSSSIFSTLSESSSTQITESSKSTQIIQKTTQVSQNVQQTSQSTFAVDYKQMAALPKTKFVWPPQKLEGDSSATSTAPAPTQNYSPLVTQSTPSNISYPPKSESLPTFRSVQPPQESETPFSIPPLPSTFSAPPLPSTFSAPPLPSTFSAQPAKVEEPPAPESTAPALMETKPPEPKKEESAPPLGSQAQNFAPVLPPVVDLKAQPTPAQPGVPTGAGSRPAPKKGRGQLKESAPGRIPICADCGEPIRGPFIIALSRTWCPNHFHCNNLHCKTQLIDIGFVEEQGQLYCEYCYEAFLAPICNKCNVRIKGDCLNALDKQWHPECFLCAYCHKPFGNNSFYLEDALPYCEKDWNELFTTKCVGCGFPIEAGDRWVEALNNNYHSQCFKCSICNKNLEGQSFYAKGGKPFCKAHAR